MPRRGDGMHGVAQHADDFGSENRLEYFNRVVGIAFVGKGNAAFCDVLTRALAQRGDIGQKALFVFLFHQTILPLKFAETTIDG